MPHHPLPTAGAALLTLLLTLPAAQAQTAAGDPAQSTGPRNGDVRDWRHHPPGQTELLARERAAGMPPGPAQRRGDTDEVEQLYHSLMRDSRAGSEPGPAPAARQPR